MWSVRRKLGKILLINAMKIAAAAQKGNFHRSFVYMMNKKRKKNRRTTFDFLSISDFIAGRVIKLTLKFRLVYINTSTWSRTVVTTICSLCRWETWVDKRDEKQVSTFSIQRILIRCSHHLCKSVKSQFSGLSDPKCFTQQHCNSIEFHQRKYFHATTFFHNTSGASQWGHLGRRKWKKNFFFV